MVNYFTCFDVRGVAVERWGWDMGLPAHTGTNACAAHGMHCACFYLLFFKINYGDAILISLIEIKDLHIAILNKILK